MLVIAGLGNPGIQYALTRHNVGFRTIDELTVKLHAQMPKEKFDGMLFQAKAGERKVLLVKPQTFMNESGRCLAQIKQFYKLNNSDFIVIYDDIDLATGSIRIRQKGSAGTHNGMRSIVTMLGGEDFARIRVGIGKPNNIDLADYVLGRFSQEEEKIIVPAILDAAEAACCAAEFDVEKAMQKFNITR